MSIDSETLEELITTYCQAWCEPGRAQRQRLLERVWAEDGTYTDPSAQVAGRNELVDHIGNFFQRFPGATIARISVVDAHHDTLRFAWRMVLGDGNVFVEGIDFGELASDGKLRRIVGFFGPLASNA